MFIFGTADTGGKGTRGGWSEMWLNGANGKGTVLMPPGGNKYPAGSPSDTFFVTDISITQKDRFGVVQCFNDRNYMYGFGHDPLGSMLDVRFVVQLGNCSGDSPGLGQLLAMYAQGRITKSLKPAKLNIGFSGQILDGFIVGMSSSTANAQLNLQSFDVGIVLPQVLKGT